MSDSTPETGATGGVPPPTAGPTPTTYDDSEDEPLELARVRNLNVFWQVVVTTLGLIAVGLAIYTIFKIDSRLEEVAEYFGYDIDAYTFLSMEYLYLLVGTMLSMVFIVFPAYSNQSRDSVPWYDVVLGLAVLTAASYLFSNSLAITEAGWEYGAPLWAQWLAMAVWVLVLEAGRRTGGWPVFFVVLVVSWYPTFAENEWLPTTIQGFQSSPLEAAAFHVYSIESLLGIPMRAFGLLVFGFLLFGVALQFTGAGGFFISFAFALLGHVRGGPAKVAIFSSGLFGSMSGGPVTNVLTTGTLTIPAMRRIGISAKTAGAIEACASTGGVMMPPIMGATAFVMADFLKISYAEVAIAAVIPSLLYYYGLYMQIDAYAARNELEGLPREELPNLKQVMLDGWYYIFVFVFLVVMLVFWKQEARAPFIATLLLLAINQFSSKHRMNLHRFYRFVQAGVQLLAELAGILCAVGLIIGALVGTGMAGTITNDLVFLAGDNVLLLLIMGAATSFILGIGMTVTAAYIFLAIILAPALIKSGLDPLPVHMFMLYWGMLSFITPPVALGAFAAASVAGSKPMETGFEAMRLGTIIYFIPFFFVFNPALLLLGDWATAGGIGAILLVNVTAIIGVMLLAGALQGYIWLFGSIGSSGPQMVARFVIGLGGLALAAPGGELMGGITIWQLIGVSAVLLVIGLVLAGLTRRVTPIRTPGLPRPSDVMGSVPQTASGSGG